MDHAIAHHGLAHLFRRRDAGSRRASSWDRTGRNRDYVVVGPGETFELMAHRGPGCVTHLYVAMILPDVRDYRDAILRCYWEDADEPSVEAPLGDFFGLSHARVRTFASQLLTVNPGMGASHGLNAYFPMPFSDSARITLEHRGDAPLGGPLGALWYHVDYETYRAPLPEGTLHFHAQYRQERSTVAVGPLPNVQLHEGINLDGRENYVALDTRGSGQMIGLHLEIDNRAGGWYGEGDDMVFVDGDGWPPAVHGTGTEEIFGGGACPNVEYAGPYTGFHMIESPSYGGLVGMYRWFVHDPIAFSQGIRWTVEHGHANNFSNSYGSVAYWYQTPLAQGFPDLPSRAELAPPLPDDYDERRQALLRRLDAVRRAGDGVAFLRACGEAEAFYRGDWESVVR